MKLAERRELLDLVLHGNLETVNKAVTAYLEDRKVPGDLVDMMANAFGNLDLYKDGTTPEGDSRVVGFIQGLAASAALFDEPEETDVADTTLKPDDDIYVVEGNNGLYRRDDLDEYGGALGILVDVNTIDAPEGTPPRKLLKATKIPKYACTVQAGKDTVVSFSRDGGSKMFTCGRVPDTDDYYVFAFNPMRTLLESGAKDADADLVRDSAAPGVTLVFHSLNQITHLAERLLKAVKSAMSHATKMPRCIDKEVPE